MRTDGRTKERADMLRHYAGYNIKMVVDEMCFNILPSFFQWSTGYQFSVAFRNICRFITSQTSHSSASYPSKLPFPTVFWVVIVVVFLPVTLPLFAQAISYHPHILSVHTISGWQPIQVTKELLYTPLSSISRRGFEYMEIFELTQDRVR